MITSPKNCRLGLLSVLVAVGTVCVLAVSGLAQGYIAPTPPLRWETDLDAAMARAEQEQRPLFLHFYGNDCQPARQMAAEVFAQPNIVAHLNATFVMVRINASENTALAQVFAVKSVPTDLILKPNRQLIHRRTGGITAERFSDYLEFLQTMIQSERGPATSPAPPAANPFPTDIAPPQQQIPPQFAPQPVAQGMIAQENKNFYEASPAPATTRDPFAQQSPFALQSPAAQPAPVAGTMPSPPANPNLLRAGDAQSKSTVEYGVQPPQVPVNAFTPPAPVAAPVPSISAIMADVPAPAKMTVEVPLALEGFCPVTLCTEERWSSGNPAYCTMYQGHIFRFSTVEAMTTFARDPANYIPVAMGEDIVLMVDRNKRINGNRKFGAWYQGRVFLFSSQDSLGAFSERPDFYTEIALKYELARREPSAPIVY